MRVEKKRGWIRRVAIHRVNSTSTATAIANSTAEPTQELSSFMHSTVQKLFFPNDTRVFDLRWNLRFLRFFLFRAAAGEKLKLRRTKQLFGGE